MSGNGLRRLAVLVAVGAALAAAREVKAGSCTFGTLSSVAFGSYSMFDPSPLDSTGEISYSCTLPVASPRLSLSAGSSGSFATRQLFSSGNSLDYNLFLDAARSVVWGDGTGGSATYDAPPPADGQVYSLTIHGRVPARQNPHVGSYADTVRVTMDF